MRVIIAAAGTGGHINPGIAIAKKIKEEEKNTEVLFIGTTRGIENDLVPREGFSLKTIEAYGFSKKISIETFKKNIKTIKSIKTATHIMKSFKPDVVIGTGGYICFPVLIAAKKLKIPALIHESNSYPGLAVKILAKKVKTIMLGIDVARNSLPSSANIVLTGTPTQIKRKNYTEEEKKIIKQNFGLNPELKTVLVFGGSQGAQRINDIMTQIVKNKLNSSFEIIWAVGQKNYEEVLSKLEYTDGKYENTKLFSYIYNMEEIMNVADLIVSRSGAITIAEITKLGKPAIFIPLPNVSHNHQEKNAKVLVDMNAAKMILNDSLTTENLLNEINRLIDSKDKLKIMSENANKLNIDNVDDKIYEEIKKVI